MAATEITEGLSVSAGLINGFDSSLGDNDGHADLGYVLGADFTIPDSLGFLGGSTLYVGYVDGSDEGQTIAAGTPAESVNTDDNTLLYIGASVNTPIEGLAVGIAYDDRQTGGGAWDADSVALYATYSLSDDASISVRYDNGTIELTTGGEDSADNLAVTLDYSIWENVTTRFELGWESGAGALGTAILSPPDARTRDGGDVAGNSSYFALNAFYSF